MYKNEFVITFLSKHKMSKRRVYGYQDNNTIGLCWIVLCNFVELETVFKEANIMVQASIITKSPKNLESSETTTISPGSSSLFKMVRGKCHIDQ